MRAHPVLRRAVGFTTGFVAALAIIVATEISRDSETSAIEIVGELDVFDYCRSGEFELEAALRDDDAHGWRCVGRRNGIWGFDELDFDEACHLQHGLHTRAHTDDPSSPYSWQCVTDR